VQPVRRKAKRKGLAGRILRWALAAALGFYLLCLFGLVYLKLLPPLTTAVQVERRVQAVIAGRDYRKRYRFVPLIRISRELQHAIIAAEDSRFYQHHGFDWKELQKVAEKGAEEGKLGRGGSPSNW
jgi:monofunctional biosynthetic peptidoglycan transglycosylase